MEVASVTRLSAALSGVTRLAIDTAPFIYLVEAHPQHLAVMRAVVGRVRSDAQEAVTSVITLSEVLTRPYATGDRFLQRAYRQIPLRSRNLRTLAIDQAAADRAAELRARYRLEPPDALQLAVALQTGCEAFLTNDARLQRLTELPVLMLDDLTV